MYTHIFTYIVYKGRIQKRKKKKKRKRRTGEMRKYVSVKVSEEHFDTSVRSSLILS